MTRNDLKQLRHYDSELRELRIHLKEMEASIGITSAPQDGQPRGNKIGRPTEEQAVRIADVLAEIRQLEEKILNARLEVWDYITSIQDSILRQIIIARFVDSLSWQDVANKIGGGISAESCRKIYFRADIDN